MIDLVTEAERYLDRSSIGSAPPPSPGRPIQGRSAPTWHGWRSGSYRRLRGLGHRQAGTPTRRAGSSVNDQTSRAARWARGPGHPDHVIWTKTVPMFGRSVEQWRIDIAPTTKRTNLERQHCACSIRHRGLSSTTSSGCSQPARTSGPPTGPVTSTDKRSGSSNRQPRSAATTLLSGRLLRCRVLGTRAARLDRVTATEVFTGEVAVITG